MNDTAILLEVRPQSLQIVMPVLFGVALFFVVLFVIIFALKKRAKYHH